MIHNYFFKTQFFAFKRLTLLLPGLLLTFVLQGQSLSQTVIVNAGDYFENGSVGSLHWTVGEIAVEHYQNDLVLSQGFHQTYFDLLSTPVWEAEIPGFQVKAYPNPTTALLTIETESTKELAVQMTNLLGQSVLAKREFNYSTELNLSALPTGTYMLLLFDEHQLIKTFKIQKIQP